MSHGLTLSIQTDHQFHFWSFPMVMQFFRRNVKMVYAVRRNETVWLLINIFDGSNIDIGNRERVGGATQTNTKQSKMTRRPATATNKETRTFAHSGTVVNDKGGNIFVISHLEIVGRKFGLWVVCLFVEEAGMKGKEESLPCLELLFCGKMTVCRKCQKKKKKEASTVGCTQYPYLVVVVGNVRRIALGMFRVLAHSQGQDQYPLLESRYKQVLGSSCKDDIDFPKNSGFRIFLEISPSSQSLL